VTKREPPGICDHCKGRIQGDIYTTNGTWRLYCCRECLNTANSRAGAPIRAEKGRLRVQQGIWNNPGAAQTPEQRRENAIKGGQAAGALFREQVQSGTWRNPALSESARAKLSRPRVNTEPILHSAVEKLTRGLKMADLTPEEADRYRQYSRNLVKRRKDKEHDKR